MKFFILVVFLPTVAFASELEDYLELANTKIPYYEDQYFGLPKAEIFRIGESTRWLVHEARYGGDGEHTENIMMIFEISRRDEVNKIFQYSLSRIEYVVDNGRLEAIHGTVIKTLCYVCDGWEVSDPEEIFRIPIIIDVPSLVIYSKFSKKEAEELITNFCKQIEITIPQQVGYGHERYPGFVKEIEIHIQGILTPYNKRMQSDHTKATPLCGGWSGALCALTIYIDQSIVLRY